MQLLVVQVPVKFDNCQNLLRAPGVEGSHGVRRTTTQCNELKFIPPEELQPG
jgi:hypothetical protein